MLHVIIFSPLATSRLPYFSAYKLPGYSIHRQEKTTSQVIARWEEQQQKPASFPEADGPIFLMRSVVARTLETVESVRNRGK